MVTTAGELFDQVGVRDRVEFASGDFFQSVPVGADAYMMKHIIHDWDDERCVTILRNIGSVMRPGGRILTIEMVVTPGNEPGFAKIQDLEMLIAPGGKERTANEYRDLLAAAGLRLSRIIPTRSPLSIIESVK